VTIPVVVPLMQPGQWPQDLIFTTCTFQYTISFNLRTFVPQAFANPAAAILRAINGAMPAQP